MRKNDKLIPATVNFAKFVSKEPHRTALQGIFFEVIGETNTSETIYRLTATDATVLYSQNFRGYLPKSITEKFHGKILNPKILSVKISDFDYKTFPYDDYIIKGTYVPYRNVTPEPLNDHKTITFGIKTEALKQIATAIDTKEDHSIYFTLYQETGKDTVATRASFYIGGELSPEHIGMVQLIHPLYHPEFKQVIDFKAERTEENTKVA